MSWETDVIKERESGLAWDLITDKHKDEFPNLTHEQCRKKFNDYYRRINRKAEVNDIQRETLITPDEVLKENGLNPSEWILKTYKNNGRIEVKPRGVTVDLSEIDRHFEELNRQDFIPPNTKRAIGRRIAEVNIADLHLGKLCWHGDTPLNYDYKIARTAYYQIISEIVGEIKSKNLEYIVFVWANDFFNSDTIAQTTTAGTQQDCDVRWQKMFNVGVEMLVRSIETLSEVAPVRTFYTPSNHDEVNGYHALKYLEAWFRQNPNVKIDTDAYPRKYILYGNTLIGFTHGDKENDRGTKQKASRLASLMPIEAAEMWSKAKYREMHAAHLHSEQMIQEINGVIVRRVSSPTAADTYHTTHGYMGAVRKAQTFIYDKDSGLVNIINTPVMEATL